MTFVNGTNGSLLPGVLVLMELGCWPLRSHRSWMKSTYKFGGQIWA